MARKVFFSFHYKNDSICVSQIRECNSITRNFNRSRFIDKAEWEAIKAKGTHEVKKWIDNNMIGTSVVIVCFGTETFKRPWVKYELEKAHTEGKGIIAIDMSGMRPMSGITGKGPNPLTIVHDENGKSLYSNNKYRSYHWENEDGRDNIDEWVELAALLVGK